MNEIKWIFFFKQSKTKRPDSNIITESISVDFNQTKDDDEVQYKDDDEVQYKDDLDDGVEEFSENEANNSLAEEEDQNGEEDDDAEIVETQDGNASSVLKTKEIIDIFESIK